jgi:hypothetical protein
MRCYYDDPVMNDRATLPKPYQREALIQLVNSVLAVGSKKAA